MFSGVPTRLFGGQEGGVARRGDGGRRLRALNHRIFQPRAPRKPSPRCVGAQYGGAECSVGRPRRRSLVGVPLRRKDRGLDSPLPAKAMAVSRPTAPRATIPRYGRPRRYAGAQPIEWGPRDWGVVHEREAPGEPSRSVRRIDARVYRRSRFGRATRGRSAEPDTKPRRHRIPARRAPHSPRPAALTVKL